MIQARTAVNEIIGIQNRPAFYDAGFGPFVRQPSGSVFSPASLFAAGEQGVWYDPSDFTTMFQDSTGTTPVTAVEQPVGLLLDKSQGLVLGSELLTNGDFASGTGWIRGANTTISGGSANISGGSGFVLYQIVVSGVSVGNLYEVTFTVSNYVSGSIRAYLGASAAFGPTVSANGTYTARFGPISGAEFGFNSASAFTGSIDNVSVKKVAGNHATQATSANRPVLSARVNLLLATATLATQSVTTLATTYTLAFSGAGTVVTTGTNIGVYTAGINTLTCTAGTLTLTVTGSVTSADLRSTTDGVGLPAYQRVTTSTDYDTTGFPLYLAFNGTNSNMVTGTITPGINKAQVFVGIRKFSGVIQIPYEFSASVNNNAGSLASYTSFNGANGADGPYWATFSKGTVAVAVAATSPASFPAPISAVQTSLHDISGSFLTLRINNTQVATSTTTQGTGNFLAYPFYIGARAAASFYFSGRIYSFIARFGANLDATTVTNAETWVNGKTKAYA